MIFQNIGCDASRVQDCLNLAKTHVRTKKMPCALMLHILASVIHAWCNKSNTVVNLVDPNLQILV